TVACERPPRPLLTRWLRGIFLDVASTPPHEEGTTATPTTTTPTTTTPTTTTPTTTTPTTTTPTKTPPKPTTSNTLLLTTPCGRFSPVSFLCLLATFINPYGWRLHSHVISYLQNDYLMDRIAEFRSFSFHSPGASYVEAFLFIAIAGI